MRTLQRFATVCFIGAAFAALISACSSSDATPPASGGAGAPGAAGAHPAGAAGTPAAGAPSAGAGGAGAAGAGAAGGGSSGLTGNPANGMAAYMAGSCATCHGAMGEGGIGPNITGSKMYGIGNWTEPQFYGAVRSAKDKGGAQLNSFMLPVAASVVSDQGVADLYALLISKPIETMNEGSICTSPGVCKGTH